MIRIPAMAFALACIVSALLGTAVGAFLVPHKPIVYTDNMLDCKNRGGEYWLRLEQNPTWNYETCEIEQKIKYD